MNNDLEDNEIFEWYNNTISENQDENIKESIDKINQDIEKIFNKRSKYENFYKQQIEIIDKAQRGDKKAMENCIKTNMGLIYTAIKKIRFQFPNLSLEDEDLKQSWMLGLCESIQKFNIKANNTFATFAFFYIRSYLQKMVRNSCTIIPDSNSFQIKNKINDLLLKNPNKSIREISQEIWITEKTAYAIRDMNLGIRSLNDIIRWSESQVEFWDTLEGENNMENILEDDRLILLKRLMHAFCTVQERDILENRFWLNDKNEMTLESIAKKKSCTRERIRQIEKVALDKLYYFASFFRKLEKDTSIFDKYRFNNEEKFIFNMFWWKINELQSIEEVAQKTWQKTWNISLILVSMADKIRNTHYLINQ